VAVHARHGRGLDPSMGWIGLSWVGLGWVENFPLLVGWVGLGLFMHIVIFFVNLTIYIYLSLSTADPTTINVGLLNLFT